MTQKPNVNRLYNAEQFMAVAIDEASCYDIGDSEILSGPYGGESDKPIVMDGLEASLVEVCEHAAAKGMGVPLEVFDRDINKKCLIGPTTDAKEIAERVERKVDNFGLMVDLSHIPILRESPAEALRLVAEPVCSPHSHRQCVHG